MKNLPLLTLLFFLYCGHYSLIGQTEVFNLENHLLHPSLPDHFEYYQLQPSGDLRVFVNTGEHYGKTPSFVDLNQFVDLQSLVVRNVDENYKYWNWSSPGFGVVTLNDGSSIIASTFFGCDVVPVGGAIKLSSSGQKEWIMDFDKPDEPGPIERIVFIDSSLIYIKVMEGAEMIIDLDGNIIPMLPPVFVYDCTIQTATGFIATKSNKLDILSNDFDVIVSFALQEAITAVHPTRTGGFIILSGSYFYLLDQELQLLSPAKPFAAGDLVWASASYYWHYLNEESILIKYDSLFSSIDTSSVPTSILPRLGVPFSDTLIVVATYNHPLNEGVVVFRGNEDSFNLNLVRDLSIVNIELPDTVPVAFIIDGFQYGWVHYYDFINVEVENLGTDTVNHFTIQYNEPSFYFQCGFAVHRWDFDIKLPPGEKLMVELGEFEPDGLFNEPGEICLSVVGSDRSTDVNPENDESCEPFSILINTSAPIKPVGFHIEPNPASQILRIHLNNDNHQAFNGHIFDSNGRRVASITISEEQNEISVSEYPNGLYFLQVIDPSKGMSTVKFVVQH